VTSRGKTTSSNVAGDFAKFVDAMFKRRSAEARYNQEQTVHWLSFLASALRRNSQTVFYLENLRGQLLPKRTQRWLSEAGTVVANLMVSGLTGLIVGLISGLIFALSGTRAWWPGCPAGCSSTSAAG